MNKNSNKMIMTCTLLIISIMFMVVWKINEKPLDTVLDGSCPTNVNCEGAN